MLTSFDDDEALFAAIVAAASGYVLKDIRCSDVVRGIRTVAAGGSLLDPTTTAHVMDRLRSGPQDNPRLADLTSQERKVLLHVADGVSNRQIAQQMVLAEKTIKNSCRTSSPSSEWSVAPRPPSSGRPSRADPGRHHDHPADG